MRICGSFPHIRIHTSTHLRINTQSSSLFQLLSELQDGGVIFLMSSPDKVLNNAFRNVSGGGEAEYWATNNLEIAEEKAVKPFNGTTNDLLKDRG